MKTELILAIASMLFVALLPLIAKGVGDLFDRVIEKQTAESLDKGKIK